MTAKKQNGLPEGTNGCLLDIIIVGGGMGGLSASIQCALSGHHVTVLEAAKELAEVRYSKGCAHPGVIRISGDDTDMSSDWCRSPSEPQRLETIAQMGPIRVFLELRGETKFIELPPVFRWEDSVQRAKLWSQHEAKVWI